MIDHHSKRYTRCRSDSSGFGSSSHPECICYPTSKWTEDRRAAAATSTTTDEILCSGQLSEQQIFYKVSTPSSIVSLQFLNWIAGAELKIMREPGTDPQWPISTYDSRIA